MGIMTVDTTAHRRLYDPARLLAVAKALPRRDDAVAVSPLQELVDGLAGSLPGAAVTVNLVWTDAVFVVASHRLPEWITEAGGVPLGWASCALVVQHDEPVLIADTHDDPAHAANPIVTDCGMRSYIGAPLRDAAGELVGALAAAHTTAGAFTAADLDLLVAAAGQAGRLLPSAR